MKYIIVVEFFAIMLAVSAMPSANSDVRCVELPEKWIEALIKCQENVSEHTYESFKSLNKTLVTREVKCLAACIYTESGEFVDGRFDPIAIEEYLREYVGSHDLLDQLVKIEVAAANEANAEEGDDCDKAYVYHASNRTPEDESVLAAIFYCPEDSN